MFSPQWRPEAPSPCRGKLNEEPVCAAVLAWLHGDAHSPCNHRIRCSSLPSSRRCRQHDEEKEECPRPGAGPPLELLLGVQLAEASLPIALLGYLITTVSSTASGAATPTSSRWAMASLDPRNMIGASTSRSSTAGGRAARDGPRACSRDCRAPLCGMRDAVARASAWCRAPCRHAMTGTRDRLLCWVCIDCQSLW